MSLSRNFWGKFFYPHEQMYSYALNFLTDQVVVLSHAAGLKKAFF
jgi:hypothetical protein